MALVIDRVDLLGCVATDARVRDDAAGTLSAPLVGAAAYHLRETIPEGCGKPLTLAFWGSGHDLVIQSGANLQPHLAAGTQAYAAVRLLRKVLETEDGTLCQSEVVCKAVDVLVLRGPDGRRTPGSPAGPFQSAWESQVSDAGWLPTSLHPPSRLVGGCLSLLPFQADRVEVVHGAPGGRDGGDSGADGNG